MMEDPFEEKRSSAVKSDSVRHPLIPRPRNIQETGLDDDFIADLICKHLHAGGVQDLHQLAEATALAGSILETVLAELRKTARVESRAAMENSKGIRYALTDRGRNEALEALMKGGYVGPAPVPLDDYIRVVQAQSVSNHKVTKDLMEAALDDTIVPGNLLGQLGPALHSGRAMMIYGLPGTGKTYICKRLARLLGEPVYIPYAISIGEAVVEYFDAVMHHPVDEVKSQHNEQFGQGHDPRFIRCERPVAISGGELTLDMLELEYDPATLRTQAPVQMKANTGMYIIDDLGRQRVPPVELFNRWIVPLEEHVDYLTLNTGQKFSVPFDLILIFSTNIDPKELADDAFLRRIGHKINFVPVNRTEYAAICQQVCEERNIDMEQGVMDDLFELYDRYSYPLLPCHPRDLLGLISDQCLYEGVRERATTERMLAAWRNYFVETKKIEKMP